AHLYADDDVGSVRHRGRALPDAFDVGRGPAPKEFSQRGYEPVPAATTSTLVAAHPAAFGALWCSSRRRRSDTADNRSLLLRLSELAKPACMVRVPKGIEAAQGIARGRSAFARAGRRERKFRARARVPQLD